MSSIEERVKKIVVEQLGVKEDEVTNSASFVEKRFENLTRLPDLRLEDKLKCRCIPT